MTILMLACFVGGFIYFNVDGNGEQATHSQADYELVEAESNAVAEFVALLTFASGLILYGYCPPIRMAVNVVLAVALGGALLDRLGDEG